MMMMMMMMMMMNTLVLYCVCDSSVWTCVDYGTAVTGLSMVGKAFITMTYSIIYVFASEVFPTEVRNVALGTGSLFGGIGSMVAPYVGAPMV